MKALGSMLFALFALGMVACANSLPPAELINARNAYTRASYAPTAQLARADMHAARKQLDVAETAFIEDGDTQNTRDQAYIALRKTEYAEVVARTMQSRQAKTKIVDTMHEEQKEAVARTAAELARATATLNDEKRRRQEAEKRAAQAAADLAKFATVKQEPRGMVITLSGSVLFASAKADLLPEAQLRLNDVANALTREDPLSPIVVEGHTDSQGNATYNQELSQRRAQAVRDYLVTRGVAADRITAQGFGPTRPIADNRSPEGRANNRRVEIIVPTATPPVP